MASDMDGGVWKFCDRVVPGCSIPDVFESNRDFFIIFCDLKLFFFFVCYYIKIFAVS